MKKINYKKEFISTLVLTVVVVAVSFFSTYWVHTERKDLRTELKELTEELNLIKREGGKMEDLEASLQVNAERIEELADIYSTDRNYINSLDAIRVLGQRNVVDISLLEPGLKNSLPDFEKYMKDLPYNLLRYTVDLELEGKFIDIGRMLNVINRHFRSMKIESFKIFDDNRSEVIRATVRIHSYRVNKL